MVQMAKCMISMRIDVDLASTLYVTTYLPGEYVRARLTSTV